MRSRALGAPRSCVRRLGRSASMIACAGAALFLAGGARTQRVRRQGRDVTRQRTIDVHAHVLTEDMMRRLAKEAPGIGPRLSEIDEHGATLQIADIVQRPFPRGGWDMELRL